jgi:predicted RNase H-like nuclease
MAISSRNLFVECPINGQKNNTMKKVIGVDGCRYGWCAAILEYKKAKIELFRSFEELAKWAFPAQRVWVDIPIGLGNKEIQRNVENQMRALLKPVRHTSVFNTPVRPAVYERNYDYAKKVHFDHTGQFISVQSWGICQKIKEVDQFLIRNKTDRDIIRESHPELCFSWWNESKPLPYAKSTSDGISLRMNLLRNHIENFDQVYENALDRFPRKAVQRHDILDALILMVNAQRSLEEIENRLVNTPAFDEHDIKMEVVY